MPALLLLLLFYIACVVNAQGGLSPTSGGGGAGNAVTYTVLVNNDTPKPIDIYFFTKPAIFDSSDGEYTNSLGTHTVQPGTTQTKFEITYSTFAAAQKFEQSVGALQSSSVSVVPIAIKTDSQMGQRTELSFDKNLDAVLKTPGVPMGMTGAAGVTVDGSFQIETPSYPAGQGEYGIGLGAIANGVYQLATYTLARPGQITNVQPVVTFYVAVGRVEKGVDASFYSISTTSAVCDATRGTTSFQVVRTNDGRWKVNGAIQ